MPIPLPPLFAGMPSPLRLAEAASLRLESISFFLLVFFVSAFVIRAIWNSLRSDFPRLPRLSYPKSLGLVGLWGLLFLLVLTMISGARELMTPGAWKKEGVTYKLDEPKAATPVEPAMPSEEVRQAKLIGLYSALTEYMRTHDGRLPAAATDIDIPADRWQTPHASKLRYLYVPNATQTAGGVLAYEPELFGEYRFVLFANGNVKRMRTADLLPLLEVEKR